MTTAAPRIVLLLIATAVLAFATAPAGAQQSPSELRRENERLRADAATTKKELTTLREEVKRLRDEIAALKKQLVAARQATPAPSAQQPEPISIDESRFETSPRALFKVLVKGYGEVTTGLFMGNSEDDPDRVVYTRKVDRWVRRVNREFKKQIEWHVRLEDPTNPLPHPHMLRLQAVDPKTGTRLGDPFDVGVTRALMSKLRQMETRRELDEVLVLRGVLRPTVRFNRDREIRGAFDKPPFIGPFAEFGFGVDATSLVPRPEPKADPDEDGATKGDDTAKGESRHDR
ncbi:MAG: hypothetical protein GY715_17485 [Planctomycetes bacterium]|nr:hypothetical protein [Planctomycetota bacterium]